MRWLPLIAPLLLSGCSNFEPENLQSPRVTLGIDGFEVCRDTPEGTQCHGWSMAEHAADERYTLTCQGVSDETCQALAESAVADVETGHQVRWVVVWPDWTEVCWVGSGATGCESIFHEPDDG